MFLILLLSIFSVHAKVANTLLSLVVPGHIFFNFAISICQGQSISKFFTMNQMIFMTTYLGVSLLQVAILLHIANWLVHFQWKRSVDPDNAAIPYLTALGDLLGGAFLTCAFLLNGLLV